MNHVNSEHDQVEQNFLQERVATSVIDRETPTI